LLYVCLCGFFLNPQSLSQVKGPAHAAEPAEQQCLEVFFCCVVVAMVASHTKNSLAGLQVETPPKTIYFSPTFSIITMPYHSPF
jgi:hypothetical protein